MFPLLFFCFVIFVIWLWLKNYYYQLVCVYRWMIRICNFIVFSCSNRLCRQKLQKLCCTYSDYVCSRAYSTVPTGFPTRYLTKGYTLLESGGREFAEMKHSKQLIEYMCNQIAVGKIVMLLITISHKYGVSARSQICFHFGICF